MLGDRKTQIIVQSALFRIAQMQRAHPRRGKDERRDGPRSGKAPGAGRGQLGITVRFKLSGDLEPTFWREALPAYCESHGVSHAFVDGGPGGRGPPGRPGDDGDQGFRGPIGDSVCVFY